METLNTSKNFSRWNLKECRAQQSRKVPAPHQNDALARLNDWYAGIREADGGILVLPTGAGKTFTAAHFLCSGPLSDGYKVLWLAHTHHLLEQAFRTFSPEILGGVREPRSSLSIRVVSGTLGHFPPRDIRPTDDVVIATLQTITGAYRENLAQLRQFIDSANRKLFVVFDEAHHSPAPSYRKLILGLQSEGATALGLTATPTYSDRSKQGWLKRIFPSGILAQARVGELMAQRVLARPHFERVQTSVVPPFDEIDYQKWVGTYRDIPENVVESLAKNGPRNALIVQSYVDNRARYGKTLIFTDRWFQCDAIAEGLRKRGVRADVIYSHKDAPAASADARNLRSRDENAKALERFRNNEVDVLVNVRMLTEGTDLPDAQTVFLTRQTTSQILQTQMIGRALRGPAFSGTEDAYIVSFVDEWQQGIRWAEYDPLTDSGQADEAPPLLPRIPIQMISIDLVRRLARQMDSGTNVTSGPFTSLMPIGWYRVVFDVAVAEDDAVEARDQLIMVFDDERQGFEELLSTLAGEPPAVFGEESVSFAEQQPILDNWRRKFFGGASRSANDLCSDVFAVVRHIAQGHGTPEFFPFEKRGDHDLDAIAKRFIDDELNPRRINESLRTEFERKDRFWRTFFPRFEQFRSYHNACQARLLGDVPDTDTKLVPSLLETPTVREPSDEVKAQVKRRDGNGCLACGNTKNLQVDHIVAWHAGGSNNVDNLQTLCRVCNGKKLKRTIRFTTQRTSLSAPPKVLDDDFEIPRGDEAGDRDYWERYLRRVLNFTYCCGAVSEVHIAGRGDGFYNWRIDLISGNPPGWMASHLEVLFSKIQNARKLAGKPAVTSITITSPEEEAVCWPPA